VHKNVTCDGCLVTPIVGVRYKCCECKNYDLCEQCEQLQVHPHSFVKITSADDVPVSMVTGINEDVPEHHPPFGGPPPFHHFRPPHHRFGGPWGGNFCGRGGRGGRGGFGRMAHHFMNIVNDVLENADCGEEGKGEEVNNFCKKWGQKRAVILKYPTEVLVGEPGKIVFAEVEVQNQTKWPWKRGCYVGLYRDSTMFNEEALPIKVKDIPVDMEVKGL